MLRERNRCARATDDQTIRTKTVDQIRQHRRARGRADETREAQRVCLRGLLAARELATWVSVEASVRIDGCPPGTGGFDACASARRRTPRGSQRRRLVAGVDRASNPLPGAPAGRAAA